MKCSKCGRENPRTAKYCGYCQNEMNDARKTGNAKWLVIIGVIILGAIASLLISFYPKEMKVDVMPETVISTESTEETVPNTSLETIAVTETSELSSDVDEHPNQGTNDVTIAMKENTWAAAYLEKVEMVQKEDDDARVILEDMNADSIPELIIAHETDLLKEESDFGWDVYSVYSFQNGKIITLADYSPICPIGMCNDSAVDIVHYNGQANLLIHSIDVDYYVEHEDGIFNEFTNTRTIYSFNGLNLVKEHEILIDAHKKDDSDDRENKEERIYFYIDGKPVQHEDVQATLNDYTGIFHDTTYFCDYLDYESDESLAVSYIHKSLLKEVSPEKDTISMADAIQKWIPFSTYAMADADKVYSYNDSTLAEKSEWYYIDTRSDEIVVMDVSTDGSALYVRYPSTTSSVGYRDRWFATEDILGRIVENPQIFNAESGTKVYYREESDTLCYYGTIWAPPECLSLGYHATENNLVIYPIGYTRPCLGFDITTKMGLVP